MSSYNHVQEPEIVTKNKALRNTQIQSLKKSIGISVDQVKKGKARYITKTPLSQLSRDLLDPETSPVAEYPFKKMNTDNFIPELEERSEFDETFNQVTLDARVRKNSSVIGRSKLPSQDLEYSPN